MDTDVQTRIDAVACWFLRNGYSVIPISEDKKPAIKWESLIEQPMAPDQWDFPGCNLALLTGAHTGIVVVDCDSKESYIGWLRTKPRTPLMVRTKSGMHFYYRHPGVYVKSNHHIPDPAGFEYDVKGDRSYVLSPPSLNSGHQYQVCVSERNLAGQFVSFKSLPIFDLAWRPNNEDTPAAWTDPQIRDGIAYIQQIRAISGEGGHNDTYRAVCRLKDSGLNSTEALAVLADWNHTNADPPWTMRELLHKVVSIYDSQPAGVPG